MTSSDAGDAVEEVDETSSLLNGTTDATNGSTSTWKPPGGFIWIEIGK